LQFGGELLLPEEVAFHDRAGVEEAAIKRENRFYNGYNFSF